MQEILKYSFTPNKDISKLYLRTGKIERKPLDFSFALVLNNFAPS
jgi:hypothetical protein